MEENKETFMKDRRYYNWNVVTGTKLYSNPTQSGICVNCIKCGSCEVGKKAKTGRTLFPEPFGLQFGAEKRIPSLSDIQILPEIFGEGIIFRHVETSTKLGGFEVNLPIVIAALGSTKVAYVNRKELSAGAANAGIIRVIGENVYPTYGEKGLRECIQPFLENYKGKGAIIVQANENDQMQNVPEIAVELGAHGIELKLGQGSKQGLGGEVRLESKEEAEKYKKMGYEIIESGGIYERHSLPGSIDKEKLKEKIKKYSKLKVPIWIKVGMGRGIIELIKYLSDLKKKENLPIEAITVDGFGGGTGMSPWLIMNETGIPSCAIFKEIDKNKKMIDIIVAGGICEGTDAAKAIMLGADGVAMGRAFLIAAQVNKEEGVVNFASALKEELQMVCAVLRKKKLTEIKGLRENLFAISQDAKEIFGLKNSI